MSETITYEEWAAELGRLQMAHEGQKASQLRQPNNVVFTQAKAWLPKTKTGKKKRKTVAVIPSKQWLPKPLRKHKKI